VAAAAVATYFIAACGAAAQPPGRFNFDLPAEPLSEALRNVAVETGRNIIAPADLVGAQHVPPLSGTFTAEEAVERLLAGTGLRYRVAEGTLIVGRGPIAEEQSAPAVGKSGEDIVVTGTHVRGAPPTSSVITLTRRQIDQLAPASVEELMRSVPQNVDAGVAPENFNSGADPDITDHGAGINLRGLGQRATLVLVNGRRVAPSGLGAFVDISLIPVSAIERVEILTDGASAIYGSDAVGGVVNLVLRDRFEGLETSLQAGTTTDGGGGEILTGATAGHSWGSGRALISYQYRFQDDIKAGDRSFTINLPDDWSLSPREYAHSLYGNLKQDLTDRLSLELSGVFANRSTIRSYFMAGPALPVNAHSAARNLGGTATLRIDLGRSWVAQLFANHFRTTSRENQFQAGGSGFINRLDSVNSIREFGVSLDGDLLELPGGTAKLALGAQTRREQFSSLFETPVNPVTLEAGSRHVRSAYGELYVPLVSARNRVAAVNRLAITAAGRFDHYDGLHSSFDPKLGILWAPTRDLTLRGSYGTSFRAPLLSETLGVYNLFLFDASILYVDPAQARPGAGAVLVGTNPSLKPETSKSLSIGGEWTPGATPGLTLRANYYRIVFSNRIALPSDDIVVVGDPALASMVTLDPSMSDVDALFAGANQVIDISGPGFTSGGANASDVVVIVDARYANTAETRTSGLDLGLDYPFDLGTSHFRAELNANKVFRFDDRLIATSPLAHQLDTPFHPVSWRARGGLSWADGPWFASAFINYTAAYQDNRPGIDKPVGSFTTFDAGIGYASDSSSTPLLRGFRIALHVKNLFDAKPPRLALEQGSTRGIGYDPVNATGRGRSVSLQLLKSFR
jgi:outer membrane receptor protein involved in Fe transport